ncbi:hypothetical protein Prubr_11410 [Polymorphospora rubra]|uniref:Uncharacterized protein n=1 Tax=Polymorphospora rubra TaxID=338584 RepID=A0A810MUC4_9ACTN|nr:hypothetical protein Prubr_11410 [Polymorphospora rubra]
MTHQDPGAAAGTIPTEPGRCECGDLEPIHVIGPRGRGACSASTCDCKRYVPGVGVAPAPGAPAGAR